MPNIKILDCTLRDGGYINNWEFGEEQIKKITEGLVCAKVDFIEYGFLSDKHLFNKNKTLYPTVSDVPFNIKSKHPALMINFGEVDLRKIENVNKNLELRITFKPYQLSDLIDYVTPLNDKKIRFSLNPMHISLYSEKDLIKLSDISNILSPECLVGVDTMGIMNGDDIKRIFELLDKKLNDKISLGFHSHNNLNLSKSNIKTFLSLKTKRTLTVDATLGGYARGGGLISTLDLCRYINTVFGGNYDTKILEDLESLMKTIYNTNSFKKEKELYYISAKTKCHPNYAKYLYDRDFKPTDIKKYLSQIPEENKPYYDINIISNIIK